MLGVAVLAPGSCYLVAGIRASSAYRDTRFLACERRPASGNSSAALLEVASGTVRLRLGAGSLGLWDVLVANQSFLAPSPDPLFVEHALWRLNVSDCVSAPVTLISMNFCAPSPSRTT